MAKGKRGNKTPSSLPMPPIHMAASPEESTSYERKYDIYNKDPSLVRGNVDLTREEFADKYGSADAMYQQKMIIGDQFKPRESVDKVNEQYGVSDYTTIPKYKEMVKSLEGGRDYDAYIVDRKDNGEYITKFPVPVVKERRGMYTEEYHTVENHLESLVLKNELGRGSFPVKVVKIGEDGDPISHRKIIESAVKNYIEVPDRVLKQYPDLKKLREQQKEEEKGKPFTKFDEVVLKKKLDSEWDNADKKLNYVMEMYRPGQRWADAAGEVFIKSVTRSFNDADIYHEKIYSNYMKDNERHFGKEVAERDFNNRYSGMGKTLKKMDEDYRKHGMFYPDPFDKTPSAFKNYITFDAKSPVNPGKDDVYRVFMSEVFRKYTDKTMNPKLDREEEGSISSYKGFGHNIINAMLSGQAKKGDLGWKEDREKLTQNDIDHYNKIIAGMDKAFSKSKTPTGMVGYHGAPQDHYKDLKVGDVFKKDSFFSTSSEQLVGKVFARAAIDRGYKPMLMKLYVPRGTPAVAVETVLKHNSSQSDRMSYYRNESELLLNRGLEYRVLRKTEKKDPQTNEKFLFLEVEVLK